MSSLWVGKSPLRAAGNILLLIPILIGFLLLLMIPGIWPDREMHPWVVALVLVMLLVLAGIAWWL